MAQLLGAVFFFPLGTVLNFLSMGTVLNHTNFGDSSQLNISGVDSLSSLSNILTIK